MRQPLAGTEEEAPWLGGFAPDERDGFEAPTRVADPDGHVHGCVDEQGSAGVRRASTSSGRTLRVVTRCTSLDEFVEGFAPLVDETSVFLVTSTELAPGTERRLVFQLADGTVALQGRTTVVEAGVADAASGRVGMRLRFTELTGTSREVHEILVAASKLPAAPRHPNTVPRWPRSPSPPPPPPIIRRPPSTPSWDNDVTRPGAPGDVEALISADAAARDAAARGVAPAVRTPDERTPGSPYTLPANPLAEVCDDALRAFVDYTLHEDSGSFPIDDDVPVVPVDSRHDATALIDLRPPRAGAPRTRLGRAVAVAAIAAFGGLGAGWAAWGRGAAAGAAAAGPQALSARAAPLRTSAAFAPAPATPAPPPVTPAPTLATRVDGADCHGRIVTVPDGVAVRWGDRELGVTPLDDVAVPCGAAHVVLARPRYQRAEQDVVAAPGASAAIEVSMQRPLGTLSLRSIPAGAAFTVDGASVDGGHELPVRTFTYVDVVAAMPGYPRRTRRVYLHGPHEAVVVDLRAVTPARAR
jgi:hypothetical protein